MELSRSFLAILDSVCWKGKWIYFLKCPERPYLLAWSLERRQRSNAIVVIGSVVATIERLQIRCPSCCHELLGLWLWLWFCGGFLCICARFSGSLRRSLVKCGFNEGHGLICLLDSWRRISRINLGCTCLAGWCFLRIGCGWYSGRLLSSRSLGRSRSMRRDGNLDSGSHCGFQGWERALRDSQHLGYTKRL